MYDFLAVSAAPIRLQFRLLSRLNPADVSLLQTLLESAPSYSFIVNGRAVAADAASQMLRALPADVAEDSKFCFAIFENGSAIGCGDLIRGHPREDVAYVGLLLFAETVQGRGRGREAVAQIDRLALTWDCRRLRLSVIATNARALSFWTRLGFRELYRRELDGWTGDAIVLERAIDTQPAGVPDVAGA